MSRICFCLLGLMITTGCDLLGNSKVDNPVFGPAPPRIRMSNDTTRGNRTGRDQLRAQGGDSGRVKLVDFDSSRDRVLADDDLAGAQVIATVNGSPVFASEVLEPFGEPLRNARKKISDAEYQKLREQILQRSLNDYIKRKLLAESLRSTLEKEQLTRLDEVVDHLFAERVEALKQEFKVNTEHEVELELNKRQNTTLAKLKDGFRVQAMGAAYMEGKAKSKKTFGRQELLAYYDEHRSEYEFPEKVHWQQLVVSFKKHDGRTGAIEHLEKAVEELRRGADFADVVRKYSDGANREKGGDFGWSQPDSLADEKIGQALRELPENMISRVLESNDSFRLVKITERKPAGRVPFGDVQAKIKAKLEKEAEQEATKKVLDELYKEAIVETIFDKK